MPPPFAATITVAETLAMLDGPKREIADGVANGLYVFWLGSGISRDRMPDLRALAKLVMTGLHARITPGEQNCRFRKALNDVVALAPPSPAEWGMIDLDVCPDQWAVFDDLAARLVNNYARMLGVMVDGEKDDFLLWNVLDAASLYSDEAVDPDSEHLCLAALGLEGVASDMPSANWDTLVERSFRLLAGDMPVLRVSVAPEELRDTQLRGNLYKFHGCAAMARDREETHRPLLVASHDRIAGWLTENEAMANFLVNLITTRRTLMLGLSAQDANIQALFAAAKSKMAWDWPANPPAYAFSENVIGNDQLSLLRNVYRDHMTPDTRQPIADEALVRAFGKPLLLALYLFVIGTKLDYMIGHPSLNLGPDEQGDLRAGLLKVRDIVARNVVPNAAVVREMLALAGRTMAILRRGALPANGKGIYAPLSVDPIARMPADESLDDNGVCQFAAALALIGMGVDRADWTIEKADLMDPKSGAMTIASERGSAKIYFAANAQAAIRLNMNGLIAANDDAVIIHSQDIVEPMPRTPRRSPGRTGLDTVRSVGMTVVLEGGDESDRIWDRFRLAVAL